MKLLVIIAAQSGLVFAQSITPPQLVKQVEPEYAAAARAKRIEGVVTLQLQVSAKGIPEKVQVVKSLNADLDALAIRAVQEWRFKPARKDGNPVAVSANVDVQFRLPRYPLLPSASPRPQDVPPLETNDDTDDWLWKIFR